MEIQSWTQAERWASERKFPDSESGKDRRDEVLRAHATESRDPMGFGQKRLRHEAGNMGPSAPEGRDLIQLLLVR